MNAMTVDVEDYFHVSAFESVVSPKDWDSYDSRVCRNTDRLLEIFDHAQVRATFFVLGWVAERFPDLVRRIASAGHEIASHGYAHRLIYDQTPQEFRSDLRRSRDALTAAHRGPINGYRAPSFSVTPRSLWALDIILDEGCRSRAARQGFEAQRPAAGEQVGHPKIVERAEPAGQHREKRFADAVGSWPRVAPRRGFERSPAPLAGDDSHFRVRRNSPSSAPSISSTDPGSRPARPKGP